MRYIVRSLVLAVALSFGLTAACQAPAPKAVEYNVGICSGGGLGVYHMVVDDKKVVFQYYVDTDMSVVKDTDPLVFDYSDEKGLKTGEVPFKGSVVIKDKNYDIQGLRYKDRVIAIIGHDDKISALVYGVVGTLNETPQIVEAASVACQDLQQMSKDEAVGALAAFLHGADKEDPKDLKASQEH